MSVNNENQPIEIANFWKSIQLYTRKPHVINRRLAGIVEITCVELIEAINKNNHQQICQQMPTLVNKLHKSNTVPDTIIDFLTTDCHLNIKKTKDFTINQPDQFGFIIVNKLLAKNLKIHNSCYELIVLDYSSKLTTFIGFDNNVDLNKDKTTLSTNRISCSSAIPPFTVQYKDNSVKIFHSLELKNEINQLNLNASWIINCFKPKLLKWCYNLADDSTIGGGTESLSILNDIEGYNLLYNQLKNKYGLDMVEKWPEKTDASKFVYEDVAIATYLLMLWKQERQDNKSDCLQSFVDLGCGNGLLVYILSSEGHPGMGIDLRKRGIWDMYPKTTVLKIEAITPSDSTLFPTTDWIIGNHSDELSPWIPVIAARSSYKTRYFLLPCCAYEFDGNKYQRQSAKLSQYNDFMSYIQTISNKCGFNETLIDRLKIPSTKRTCIIGLLDRNYPIDGFQIKCNEIQEFINSRTKSSCENVEKSWTNTFKPRSDIEIVKNCTKIDETIQKNIVKCVWEYLLTKHRYFEDFCNPKWNMGGVAKLSDLIKLIPIDELKMLKAECGGLQTLLRNNHQIFMVEKGNVQIRRPISYPERLQQIKDKQQNSRGGSGGNGREKDFLFKQKPCWFLDNHPDGCPFKADDCSFKH